MYVPDSYIIAHTLEDTLAPDGSHVLVFNWAWLFLAAVLHFVLVAMEIDWGPSFILKSIKKCFIKK